MQTVIVNCALITGFGMLAWGLSGILRGRIESKGHDGPIEKSAEPVNFWFTVGTYLLTGIGLLGMFGWLRGPSVVKFWTLTPIAAKANAGGEACFGKSECIIAYVAPWCPYCNQSVGCLKEMSAQLKNSPAIGISYFVGWDKADRLEEFAAEIGPNTFIDRGGAFKSLARVTSLPTWLLIDERGRVKGRFSGSPQPCDLESVKFLLRKN